VLNKTNNSDTIAYSRDYRTEEIASDLYKPWHNPKHISGNNLSHVRLNIVMSGCIIYLVISLYMLAAI